MDGKRRAVEFCSVGVNSYYLNCFDSQPLPKDKFTNVKIKKVEIDGSYPYAYWYTVEVDGKVIFFSLDENAKVYVNVNIYFGSDENLEEAAIVKNFEYKNLL